MANIRYQVEGNAPQLYERETVHTLGSLLAELMFAHVALHADDWVLDAACGTGIVTCVAAQRFRHLAHIVGLDLNPGMLEVARAHTPTPGVPVAWRQGDLAALPFADDSFEVVLCQQGLQFVPDPGAALREMRRVLVPGGRLVFTVFSEVPVYYAVRADALARHVSAAAATSCLSRYTLQEAATLRPLVDAAGFGAITYTCPGGQATHAGVSGIHCRGDGAGPLCPGCRRCGGGCPSRDRAGSQCRPARVSRWRRGRDPPSQPSGPRAESLSCPHAQPCRTKQWSGLEKSASFFQPLTAGVRCQFCLRREGHGFLPPWRARAPLDNPWEEGLRALCVLGHCAS
jgi:ubiquinone/menaquinone biosynthesis C-methylase UbiE